MIRFNALAAGVLVLCATGSAFAQDDAASEQGDTASPQSESVNVQSGSASAKKFQLGLRLGYAVPSGKIDGDSTVLGESHPGTKLSDLVTGQVPIWLDVGYMVTPNVLLGVYGQYGFGSLKDCPDGVSCSAHDLRIGVQAQYHFTPFESVDPWLGAGFGYESLALSASGGGRTFVDGSITGWEFLNLQGGVDFQVANAITIGPFLSFSLDQFTSAKSNGNSDDIDPTALHEWITFGAKGTFGI